MSLALVILAAFFNSVMDALENENYFESIFKDMKRSFWYKRESWKYAKRVLGYKVDAWHISKSCMVVALALAISLGVGGGAAFDTGKKWLDVLLNLIASGILWNLTFNLVYHKIFRIK